MAKVDKHGLKMIGLKQASSETFANYYTKYNSEYREIFYNTETGEVFTIYQPSINNWSVIDNPNIIRVCNCFQKLHMQEIADLIADRLYEIKALDDWAK